MGDKQGAVADFNQAIKINPNLAIAYNNRGIVRSELGDKQGAVADLQKAAELFTGLTQLAHLYKTVTLNLFGSNVNKSILTNISFKLKYMCQLTL